MNPIRSERRRAGWFAIMCILVFGVPAALAALALWAWLPKWWAWLVALPPALFALWVAGPMLRFQKWTEFDGQTVTMRRFFTGVTRRSTIDKLLIIRGELGLDLDEKARPINPPRLGAASYQILFSDKMLVYLGKVGMTKTEEFIEALLERLAGGIVLPVRLGDWVFHGYTNLAEINEGNADRTFAYRHLCGAEITLYRFARGDGYLPDGVESPAIRREMDGAAAAILEMQSAGLYQNVELADEQQITLGKLPALRLDLTLTAEPGMVCSTIILTAVFGQFFKLRCTYAADNAKAARSALAQLIEGLGVLLRPA